MCGPNLKSAVERNNLSNKDWYLIMCVLCITKSAHFNSIVKGKNKLDKSQGTGSKRLFSFHPELTPKKHTITNTSVLQKSFKNWPWIWLQHQGDGIMNWFLIYFIFYTSLYQEEEKYAFFGSLNCPPIFWFELKKGKIWTCSLRRPGPLQKI